MNVQELRYVVAVAQAGSINKAALNLYVSQSTLSRAVQEVEALGFYQRYRLSCPARNYLTPKTN